MHIRGNFKTIKKDGLFFVKIMHIKKICDVAELHKNPRNPISIKDGFYVIFLTFKIWENEKGKNQKIIFDCS